MQRASRFTIALFFCFMAAVPALASTSGISQVDSGGNSIVTLVEYLAGLGAIVLIAFSIWELFGHGKLKQAGVEFVSGVIVGILAVNAQSIASFLHLTGALVK